MDGIIILLLILFVSAVVLILYFAWKDWREYGSIERKMMNLIRSDKMAIKRDEDLY